MTQTSNIPLRFIGCDVDKAKIVVHDSRDGRIRIVKNRAKELAAFARSLDRTCLVVCEAIGFITAVNLLALMPELGTLNRRQIASLGGLAPHPRQSGMTDKYRFVKGGRTDVKAVLFMAALSANRHHTTLRGFYEQLVGRAN